MIYTLIVLCLAGTGMYFLLFIAPCMPDPVNKCRLFILVNKNQPKSEENMHVPWWFTALLIIILISCQVWPALGYTVLGSGLVVLGILKLIQHIPNVNDLIDSAVMWIIALTTKLKGKQQ